MLVISKKFTSGSLLNSATIQFLVKDLFEDSELGSSLSQNLFRKPYNYQIQAEQFDYIHDFLTEESLTFFTLEELEQIFDMVDVSEQKLLRKVNGLINRKRIIESLKARKSIKISEKRIRAYYSDF